MHLYMQEIRPLNITCNLHNHIITALRRVGAVSAEKLRLLPAPRLRYPIFDCQCHYRSPLTPLASPTHTECQSRLAALFHEPALSYEKTLHQQQTVFPVSSQYGVELPFARLSQGHKVNNTAFQLPTRQVSRCAARLQVSRCAAISDAACASAASSPSHLVVGHR